MADRLLTPHFSLMEMQRSGTAIEQGIDNTIPPEAQRRLTLLCRHVLEPLRQRFERIIITSGYRCKELNKAVGGVDNSQHTTGEAADIHVSDQEQALRFLNFLTEHTDFDQIILEPRHRLRKRWIHVSYTQERKNRRMVLE